MTKKTWPLTPLGTLLLGLPIALATGLTLGHLATPNDEGVGSDMRPTTPWETCITAANGPNGFAPEVCEPLMETLAPIPEGTYSVPPEYATEPTQASQTQVSECNEDEPCWDCTTMGNMICGTPDPE